MTISSVGSGLGNPQITGAEANAGNHRAQGSNTISNIDQVEQTTHKKAQGHKRSDAVDLRLQKNGNEHSFFRDIVGGIQITI